MHASYTKKKDQDPAQRMNQLGLGLGLQENILLHGGWVQDLRATTVLENCFLGQNKQETRTFSCNKIWQGLHQQMVEILHPVC